MKTLTKTGYNPPKTIYIHSIDNVGGNWCLDFIRTQDYHLEIIATTRINSGAQTKIILNNIDNNELLELAKAIQDKLSNDE